MRGYITFKRPRILGARLHIHWSALVGAGVGFCAFIHQPAHALVLVLSYFGLILLHETGHALIAKRLGYSPTDIYLALIHGLCQLERDEYEDTLKEIAMIAWGGVLLQLVIATPLIALSVLTPLDSIPLLNIMVAVLGYYSILVVFLNLMPVRGLDGAFAWHLLPILFRERRDSSVAKKASKDFIRRVK